MSRLKDDISRREEETMGTRVVDIQRQAYKNEKPIDGIVTLLTENGQHIEIPFRAVDKGGKLMDENEPIFLLKNPEVNIGNATLEPIIRISMEEKDNGKTQISGQVREGEWIPE